MHIEDYLRDAAHREPDRDAFTDFRNSLIDGFKQPVQGARQIGGAEITVADHSNDSISGKAGHAVATAVLFLGANAVARRLPGIGKIAPIIAGGALGALTPTENNNGTDRLANTLVGAGTSAVLELGNCASLQKSLSGFGSVAVTNLGAGALQAQTESIIKTGSVASIKDTALSAGMWFATGTAFHAFGRVLGGKPGAANENSNREPFVETLGNNDFRVRLGNRLYDVHTPAGVDVNGTKPLRALISLDGVAPKTIGNMARETQFNLLSDASKDTVIIYPYAQQKPIFKLGPFSFGKAHSWNVPETGLSGYHPKFGNDMAYLDGVISDAQKRFNIDAKAISAVGFSEGGMILHSYAAQRPGKFAAIASIHGTATGREAEFAVPRTVMEPAPRVLVVHSDKDRVIKENGGASIFTWLMPGASRSKPAMQESFWAQQHGAHQTLKTTDGVIARTDYLKDDGSVVVTRLNVRGGGHAWDGSPTGGSAIFGRPLPREVFSTSDAVWDFTRSATDRALAAEKVRPLVLFRQDPGRAVDEYLRYLARCNSPG